jgi:hypothetical protein
LSGILHTNSGVFENAKDKADQSSKLFQVSYQYQLNPTFNAIYDYPGGVKASFSSILANKFEDQTIKFYGDKGTIVSNRMNEALLYPEDDTNTQWNEDIDAVSGASIKIIDKNKGRSINLPEEAKKGNMFEGNYEQTTWLLYKNFAAAIKGEEKLLMGLKDGYQSAISVHMANMAIREQRVERWLPEYDV